MRKLIIALLLFTIHSTLCTYEAHAEYTGGSGAGWGYAQITPAMYHGGSGDGDHMAAYSTDTAVAHGTATKIVFTTQPTNSVKNATLATSPVVEVRDASDNKITTGSSSTATITMAILNNPGSATLGGTTSKAASSGSATFSDLTINQYGTGYTLSASASGLTSATSDAFNISYGTKSKLAFITQPSNALPNQAFGTMPVVVVQDAQGNTVETATDTITLAVQAGGGGILYTSGGTTPVTKAATAGVADWTGSGIFVDLIGSEYTLLASATDLTSATSNTFVVANAPSSSGVSAVQTTDGSRNVMVSYTATDNGSYNCNLTTSASQAQYSLDNATWSNATISGTTTGIASSPDGVAHSDLIWAAGTDVNNTEDSTVYFRIKLHNGAGYAANYSSTASSFVVDTKTPTNVSIGSPENNAIDVVLSPTITASTAIDMSSAQYYFQLASNFVFTADVQTRDWNSSSSWTPTELVLNTTYYVRVKVKDAYGNTSNYCGSTADTTGYATFTTVQSAHSQPAISSISGSQLTDGSKKVLITYTVSDAEANNCDVTQVATQVQYSTDNSTWTNATVSGTTSGITASSGGTTHNASNQPLYWEAGTDLNDTEDNTVYFRIKLYNGYNYMSSYATTSAFVLDTKAPVISSATAFSSSPAAGDTTITLTATWTEANPNTSAFYYALNDTTYSSAQAGSTNTTTPSVTISLGAALDGDDYFDKIKSTATDDYGNVSSASEVLTDVGVKPYQPAQPTAQNVSYTSCEIIPNKNTSEVSGLSYAIYITPIPSGGLGNYLAADGSTSTAAVWQTAALWGTLSVTGLSNSTSYTFKTKSRNSNVISVESDFSAIRSIGTLTPGQTPTLKADYSYNADTDSLTFAVWLESGSAMIVPSGSDSTTINIYDSSGNLMNSSAIASSAWDSSGIFWLNWTPTGGTGLAENTNYTAKITTTHGNEYSTTLVVNITTAKKLSDISTSVGTNLSVKVSAIQDSVGTSLATKVDTLQGDIDSVKTAVGADQSTTLYSQVANILEDTGTTIPETITSELKKGPRSKILNRPTSIISGEKVTIRYQTDSGKNPSIIVYDANNIARVSGATMTEIGSTGVYEHDVTFQSGWGTGDYTIICSESTTSSADSMIINVGSGTGLTGIEAKVDSLTNTLSTVNTNISTIKSVIGTTSDTSSSNTLYGKLAGVSTNLGSVVSKWGSYSASDIIGYVDGLEGYLGAPANGAGQQTVFGKIAEIKNYVGDTSGLGTKVNAAYNEIQQLRKEVDFNGKSETAYNMVKSVNSTMEEVKTLLAKANEEAGKTDLEKLSASTEEARKVLKEVAEKQGLKGAVEKEVYKGPVTLDSLQNQVAELKKLTETVKIMLEKKEEPVVKTWFEQGEPK